MAKISVAYGMDGWLARLRRRAWVAVGICLSGQIGNAALHANAPSSETYAVTSQSEACPATPLRAQNHQSDNSTSGILL
jgi:hypothetical protein